MRHLVFNKLRHAIDFSHLVSGRIKRCDDGTYIVWWHSLIKGQYN